MTSKLKKRFPTLFRNPIAIVLRRVDEPSAVREIALPDAAAALPHQLYIALRVEPDLTLDLFCDAVGRIALDENDLGVNAEIRRANRRGSKTLRYYSSNSPCGHDALKPAFRSSERERHAIRTPWTAA